ncbi:putative uracil DNA glycosylase UNG [Alphaentomopoxvirus acuprea]|uniref:Uracil-DNA glycosylase n=1 Tax=Alphaentomopoxvirus acuprea TaxID=62099 RepID=W6JPJ7_9POXV|nr:putative uracil DNA glycosylase UNG [Anomala cuprea entomopoxvirus]BAO49399.1 putative uracil DNA glycosylase UNG [Anomala cuprea entomopoxvirus]
MNLNFEEFSSLIPTEWESYFNKSDLLLVYNNLKLQEIIKPDNTKIFRCFQYFNPQATKVVILGQDPYFTNNMADGLCFSCPNNTRSIPPSLANIIKVIAKDFKQMEILNNIDTNRNIINSDLSFLSEQGVLLINSILTVGDKALSHKNIGWEYITSKILNKLSKDYKNIVFMLFGSKAHEHENYITNKNDHYIIKTSHPSPFSYAYEYGRYDSLLNSKCFTKCNNYLKNSNLDEIDWCSKLINEQ